jgi:hypothetical protein
MPPTCSGSSGGGIPLVSQPQCNALGAWLPAPRLRGMPGSQWPLSRQRVWYNQWDDIDVRVARLSRMRARTHPGSVVQRVQLVLVAVHQKLLRGEAAQQGGARAGRRRRQLRHQQALQHKVEGDEDGVLREAGRGHVPPAARVLVQHVPAGQVGGAQVGVLGGGQGWGVGSGGWRVRGKGASRHGGHEDAHILYRQSAQAGGRAWRLYHCSGWQQALGCQRPLPAMACAGCFQPAAPAPPRLPAPDEVQEGVAAGRVWRGAAHHLRDQGQLLLVHQLHCLAQPVRRRSKARLAGARLAAAPPPDAGQQGLEVAGGGGLARQEALREQVAVRVLQPHCLQGGRGRARVQGGRGAGWLARVLRAVVRVVRIAVQAAQSTRPRGVGGGVGGGGDSAVLCRGRGTTRLGQERRQRQGPGGASGSEAPQHPQHSCTPRSP